MKKLNILQGVALVTFAGMLALANLSAAAGYSMQITVTNFAGRGTLTNFPSLVKLDTSNTDSYSEFLDTSNGYDLRFWTNSALSGTELNYEVESFDTNGTSYIWVQVSTFTQDASIWASWGNPAYTNQEAYTTNGAVWSEGYVGVWHLGDANDSGTNGYDGTMQGNASTVTGGMVNSAYTFDGDGDYIDLVDHDFTTDLTIEAWARRAGDSTGRSGTVVGKKINDAAFFYEWYNDDYNNTIRFYTWGLSSGADLESASSLADDTWYHLSGTYDGSTKRIYLNGNVDNSTSASGSISVNNENLMIGYGVGSGGLDNYFNGLIDEVRISDVARSTNWVWASYMNQGTNHTALMEYGAVEAVTTTTYSMQITYTNFVGRGTLTNFPALVKLDASNTENYAGFLDTTDGYDLRFWTNSALSGTELNYEIESFDTNGTSCIWVQMPAFTQDSSIWASWGDPANTNQEAYTTNGAVWSEGFAGVWHLGEGSTDVRRDSTVNTNHTGTLHGNPDVGVENVVGNANYFDGDDALEVPDSPSIGDNVRTNLTYGMWIRPDNELTAGGSGTRSLEKGDSYFFLQALADGGQNPLVKIGGNEYTGIQTALSAGTWYYLTATFDGAAGGELAAFLDGERKSVLGSLGGQIDDGGNLPLFIGADDAGSYFQGHLDELRISAVTRSTNWIWASYMNQGTNHSAFVEYSAVESPNSVSMLWSSETTSDITDTSAVATATINTNLTEAVLVWAGSDQGTGNTNDWANRLGLGTQSVGSVTGQITNLDALTDYVWRLYGDDGTTNAWSAAVSFTALGPPAVTNDPTATYLDTTATLYGTVTAFNDTALQVVKIYLGDEDGGITPANWDTNYVVSVGLVTEGAPFSVSVSNLLPETQYSYRAYVSNSVGDAWASVTNFTTYPALSASGGSTINYYTDAGGTSWFAHVFSDIGSDNFVPDGPLNVEYLIVAGGGGGGGLSWQTRIGGGGGAGGLLSGSSSLTADPYLIEVGGGGAGGGSGDVGDNGQNSKAFGLTAIGGGGGGGNDTGQHDGEAGGSGGGSRGGSGSGGAGTAGQGHDGATSTDGSKGGGGGGALAAGSVHEGGAGFVSSITGSTSTYAAGGNGGLQSNGNLDGASAADNTGSGGDGGSRVSSDEGAKLGGAGGSGIVVIRYRAGGDKLAPEIASLSPTNSATSVLVDADLIASFNEPIATNTTGSVVITNLSDNILVTTIAIGDTSQITVSDTNLTINPTNDLSFGKDYAVLIDTNALTDAVGNFFAGITNTTTWVFQTIVPTAPVVTNTGATRIGAVKARLNGQVSSFSGVPLSEVRIYFGTGDPGATAIGWDTSYVFNAASITEGVGFFTNVVDLSGQYSYSYRVYASNDYGEAWSDVDTFTTELAGTVTLDDTASFVGSGGTFSINDIPDFDPSGADKLVVTLSDEDNVAVTGVTYGGQAMTLAVQRVNTMRKTYIWYLDDPGSAGNLVISPSSSLGGSLLALSGTRDGVGPTNMTETLSAMLTTERNNTFVVASFVENGGANGTTAQSPFTSIFTANVGSTCGASGYLYVSNAPTLVTATFDGSSGNDPATAVAGFEGVDAPAGPTLFRFR